MTPALCLHRDQTISTSFGYQEAPRFDLKGITRTLARPYPLGLYVTRYRPVDDLSLAVERSPDPRAFTELRCVIVSIFIFVTIPSFITLAMSGNYAASLGR